SGDPDPYAAGASWPRFPPRPRVTARGVSRALAGWRCGVGAAGENLDFGGVPGPRPLRGAASVEAVWGPAKPTGRQETRHTKRRRTPASQDGGPRPRNDPRPSAQIRVKTPPPPAGVAGPGDALNSGSRPCRGAP